MSLWLVEFSQREKYVIIKECNDIANVTKKFFYQEENSLSEVWTRQLKIAYLDMETFFSTKMI